MRTESPLGAESIDSMRRAPLTSEEILISLLKAKWFASNQMDVGRSINEVPGLQIFALLWTCTWLWVSRFWLVDRRTRLGLWAFIFSHRYWGTFPWIHLCIRQSALKVILSFTGNQWRDLREGEIYSHGFIPVTSRAAVFWTTCRRVIWYLESKIEGIRIVKSGINNYISDRRLVSCISFF